MDSTSWQGFDDRLRELETVLSVSEGGTPILVQLELLNQAVDLIVSDEHRQMFKELASRWSHVATMKSHAGYDDVEDAELEKMANIVIASKSRIHAFLLKYEHFIDLQTTLNKLVKSAQGNYQAYLNLQLPEQQCAQLNDNLSKLIVRSMLLLERNLLFMANENRYWADLETRMIELQRKIHLKRQIDLKNKLYT